MSIIFQTEKFSGKLAGEIEALVLPHGDIVCSHLEALGAPEIDWQYYLSAYYQGGVSIFTARDGEKLIGVVINIAGREAHFCGKTRLRDGVYCLAPEYRGSHLGIQFMIEAEKEREKSGADVLWWASKKKSDCRAIFERMGYIEEETYFSKINPQRGSAK